MQDKIKAGLRTLGLTYTSDQVRQLAEFVRLIKKWSQAFNLVANDNTEQLLNQHVFDSLAVNAYLQGNRILDVGAGAGFPGIPLAIMNKEFQFSLLDSNGKKTRFLWQAALELSLAERIEVIKSRIEEYHPAQPFDTVISRAFAGLGEFVRASLHVCDQHSLMLAMKSRRLDAELRAMKTDVRVLQTIPLRVPGIEAERYLVCLQRLTEKK